MASTVCMTVQYWSGVMLMELEVDKVHNYYTVHIVDQLYVFLLSLICRCERSLL